MSSRNANTFSFSLSILTTFHKKDKKTGIHSPPRPHAVKFSSSSFSNVPQRKQANSVEEFKCINAIMVDKNEKGARTDGIHEGRIFRMKGMALVKMPFTTIFECSLHLWAPFLYTMALMIASFMVKENQVYKPMLLAGPFFLVSGALLVLNTTEGEEGERPIMKELGEEVSEDEMLQLLKQKTLII